MHMNDFRRLTTVVGWVLVWLMVPACLQLRPISLYDRVEEAPVPAKPESIEQVVGSTLFEDDTLDIWGIVADSCKTFALTEGVVYQGEAALALDWNREGCEWVGFGMGWDGYAGKDLSPLIPHAAFEMYVRAQEGKMFGLPMVFTLEDYSGVMAFAYTANKYFERTAIDEEWQRVVVPLKAFSDEGKGIDYTNIKQLQIEMQQAGAVYVDEIKLVFYEEPEQEPWLEEPALPDPTKLPQPLFDEGFVNGNGWGMIKDDCQDISLSTAEAYTGKQSLHVQWDNDPENCSLVAFGVNWYHWKPIDIRPMEDKAVLAFNLLAQDIAKLDFTLVLEEFDAPGMMSVKMDPTYAFRTETDWYEVRIPLDAFEGQMDKTKVQHLVFALEGEGTFYLDNMRWVAKPKQ